MAPHSTSAPNVSSIPEWISDDARVILLLSVQSAAAGARGNLLSRVYVVCSSKRISQIVSDVPKTAQEMRLELVFQDRVPTLYKKGSCENRLFKTFGGERSCVIEQETISTTMRAHTTGFVIAEMKKEETQPPGFPLSGSDKI